ncbi:hypothetical protein [Pseudomonas sp. 25 E 4]|nr:DUF1989 domain-containing protein [Pseudomonas sp. 25 E 4]CRM20193.1 hypothetical protein [Pseudomonas sp. 25 E 4]
MQFLPHGLTEFDVHDVLNTFQRANLNHDDLYFMKACPAQKGHYFEFFAELTCCAHCQCAQMGQCGGRKDCTR